MYRDHCSYSDGFDSCHVHGVKVSSMNPLPLVLGSRGRFKSHFRGRTEPPDRDRRQLSDSPTVKKSPLVSAMSDLIHRLCGRAIVVLLFAATLILTSSETKAQVSRDIEVTTDAGEKFHLVYLQGTDYDIYTEADSKKIGSVDLRTQNPVVVGPDYAANGAAMSRVVAASRVPGHAQSYSGPPIAAAAESRNGAHAAAPGELPPCPLGSVANYWNGTSWAPMRTPEMLNGKSGFSVGDALKNPFNAGVAGTTGIARFKGAGAPVTVDSSPKFCFFVSQNLSSDFLVGFVDVKDDHREIEFHRGNRGPEKWIPVKRQKAATTKFVGNAAIVTLNETLPAGQYIVGRDSQVMYDFGVN